MQTTIPLIALNNIEKVFLTDELETHALSGVCFEIRHGDYVSISGPSGCGKSTLLAILGLLDSPTNGSYQLRGEPVAQLNPAQRARVRNREIGFIFQSFNLIGDLTVWENIELPLTYRGLTKEERRERVDEALTKVGMTARAKHYPAQLSGGQGTLDCAHRLHELLELGIFIVGDLHRLAELDAVVHGNFEVETGAARPRAPVGDVAGKTLLAAVEIDGGDTLSGLHQGNGDMQRGGGFSRPALLVAQHDDMRRTELSLTRLNQHDSIPARYLQPRAAAVK